MSAASSAPAPAAQSTLLRDPAAISLLIAGVLLITANNTISPALSGLEAQFADTPNAGMMIRFLVPAPSLTVALFAPFIGRLVDSIGRRPMLAAGVALFALTGGAGALLPELWMILAARLLMGVAVAMVMTAQAALIGDYFAGHRRSAFMGMQMSAKNFGGLIFIALSGWIAGISPRLPFLIYAAAILVLPLVWIAFRDKAPGAEPMNTGNPTAGDHPATIRTSWKPAVIGIAALQAAATVIFFFMPTQTPFYAEHLGLPPASTTSWTLGSAMFIGGIVALSFAKLSDRFAPATVLALAFAMMAAGFASFQMASGLPLLMLAGALLASGYGLVMPSLMAVVLNITPAAHRGLGVGMLTTGLYLGQVVSPFVSQPMIATLGWSGSYFAGCLFFLALMAGSLSVPLWRGKTRAAA